MSTAPATSTGAAPLTGARLWVAAVGLALTNFVVILDTTITNVSVPHIAGGLAISPSQGTWTITSYAVAEAITVPLSGWLAGRFGTHRLLLFSVAGFALFSVLCGLARTIELLVILRVFQGLFGGPLMPLTQILLLRIFPPEKMGAANAIWGVTAIAAPIVGPITGGWISDNWSWPWIFYINLPVCLACIAIIGILVARYETAVRRERIDTVGLALLVLFVGSLQLMLDLGREHDWFASPMIVVFAIVSAISFGVFVIWELTDPNPVVDLRVLRHRTLWVGLIGIGLGFGSMFAMIVLVPLWLQSSLGYTASDSGQAMALVGVFAVMFAPVAGKLLQIVDMRITITFGMMWLGLTALLRTLWTTDGTFWDYGLPQLAQGLGMPFFFVGMMTFALTSVPDRQIPAAASLLSFIRTISGAAATALATSAWDGATRTSREEMVASLKGAEQFAQGMQAQGVSPDGARALVERLVDVQSATVGTHEVFYIATVVACTAAWLVWLCPRPVVRTTAVAAH